MRLKYKHEFTCAAAFALPFLAVMASAIKCQPKGYANVLVVVLALGLPILFLNIAGRFFHDVIIVFNDGVMMYSKGETFVFEWRDFESVKPVVKWYSSSENSLSAGSFNLKLAPASLATVQGRAIKKLSDGIRLVEDPEIMKELHSLVSKQITANLRKA